MVLGWSARQIVIILYLVTVVLSAAALATARFD
jgi:UDP-N-acetylmuramyl pentapeptide phosphotransferase/UDP-N-acetylglucosamine-1-phosphate transferase